MVTVLQELEDPEGGELRGGEREATRDRTLLHRRAAVRRVLSYFI